MTSVSLSDRIVLDEVDITDSVLGWRLDRNGRDVPTLILELNGAGVDDPYFEGYANVRIGRQDPSIEEFLAAINAGELESMVLERDDLDRSGIAVALDLLREMAPRA